MSNIEKVDKYNGKVILLIAGKEVKMVPFVHNILRDMILSFTKNLKGHSGGKIEIIVEK